MSPKEAAIVMLAQFGIPDEEEGAQSPNGDTQDHLVFMLRTIRGYDNTQKAHRWLGYAQCLAICLGLTDLETMKRINKEA